MTDRHTASLTEVEIAAARIAIKRLLRDRPQYGTDKLRANLESALRVLDDFPDGAQLRRPLR